MISSVERSERGYVSKWGTERDECELCGTETQCVPHGELVACRDCRSRYLSAVSLL